jgi:hypothetical protein
MKAIVLALAALVATAPVVGANEVGRIAIFSDEALTNSALVDDSFRQVEIYVAHVDHTGVTGSQFKIQVDEGFTGYFMAETLPWAPYVIGTALTGVTIAYAQCAATDIILVRLTYFLVGTSLPCSGLSVVPHPDGPGNMLCLGCNMFEVPCAPPGSLRVNCTVAVEESTWGGVKALYR